MPRVVFVRDCHNTPLCPMSPAHARKLLTKGKAYWLKHTPLPVLQLNYAIHTVPNKTLFLLVFREHHQFYVALMLQHTEQVVCLVQFNHSYTALKWTPTRFHRSIFPTMLIRQLSRLVPLRSIAIQTPLPRLLRPLLFRLRHHYPVILVNQAWVMNIRKQTQMQIRSPPV